MIGEILLALIFIGIPIYMLIGLGAMTYTDDGYYFALWLPFLLWNIGRLIWYCMKMVWSVPSRLKTAYVEYNRPPSPSEVIAGMVGVLATRHIDNWTEHDFNYKNLRIEVRDGWQDLPNFRVRLGDELINSDGELRKTLAVAYKNRQERIAAKVKFEREQRLLNELEGLMK